ncbi:nitrate- and nitrite sensing domain-containing protein [Streptomyces sp. DW26H14]|uniref:nitrate- and nitrite sensing domain-containing protein n=1 Tax=Streptomyces sp. DW26H14 TaxID=3435395 RepID=UPI00403DABB4
MRRSRTSSAEEARDGATATPRAAVPPSAAPAAATGSSSRLSPRNWRVPTRLNAILLLPVLVGLVMGGFQVKGSVHTWHEARDAEHTARVVRAASDYSQALLNERDLTAQPLLTGHRDDPLVSRTRAATDRAKKRFDAAASTMPDEPRLKHRLSLFRAVEPKLARLRASAYTDAIETPDKSDGHGGPVATQEGYVQVQHSLMEFSNELGLGTGNITSYGRTLYAIQLAKAAESLQRSIGLELLVRPNPKPDIRSGQLVALNSYAYLEGISVEEYQSGGTAADTARLTAVMKKVAAQDPPKGSVPADVTPPRSTGGSVLDGMAAAIGSGKSPKDLKAEGITPATWMAASTAKFDGYTTIEKGLVAKAVTDAGDIASNARRTAILNGAGVLLALLVAFVIAALMARQMSHAMRALRTAAFGIAEQRLPLMVDQLSRSGPNARPEQLATRVAPIPVDSRDEIGEVARAFDQVHREAVRLAAEQAMLRGNVNAIFTNLSRRNQSLIEGQLTLITELENHEGEPEQLENLFKLDHLATRMRRNGENLLVLAGEEPGHRWNQPVSLVDVLRAACSEVEAYERIELAGLPETEIHGQAVTDLVHLLAELLENATTFSSPQTRVRVTATRLPDSRLMIEIHDRGIGLTAEDFAEINHKLANPPTVDVAVSQRMGLFVVGRLADRHGIRVQLRPSGEQAGTTSLVMLPDAITHGGGGGAGAPEEGFTVSGIIPEHPSALPAGPGYGAPALTAAELGFDDSRYGQDPVREARTLDPVNRTLMRDERRAALEAGPDRSPAALAPGSQDGTQGPGLTQEGPAPAPEQQFWLYGRQEQDPGAGTYDGQPQGSGTGVYDGPRESPGTGLYDAGRQQAPEDPYGDGRPYPDADGWQGYPGSQPGAAYGDYVQGAAYATPGGYGDAQGYGPQDGYPTQDTYPAQDGRPAQDGFLGTDHHTAPAPYDEQRGDAHPEAPYATGGDAGAPGAEDFGIGFEQGEWANAGTYQEAFPVLPEAESEPAFDADGNGGDRLGFERSGPGPSPSASHTLTEAGLPRRGTAKPRQDRQEPPPAQDTDTTTGTGAAGHLPTAASDGHNGPDGADGPEQPRSANDERFLRAGKLRDPKAGGVTSSGLPKRVPKANLVEGSAEQAPQEGPQVSRAPEDIRGRLSNLRSGVQRGRDAGADMNRPGHGPGGTYNQER